MKQNFQTLIYYIFIGIFIGFINYFVTLNYYFSIVVCMLLIMFSLIVVTSKQQRADLIKDRTLECTSFIHEYIYGLEKYSNHDEVLNKMSDSFSQSLKEQLGLIKHLSTIEKVEYLEKYFKLNIYKFFVKFVKEVEFCKENYKNTAKQLLSDVRKIEESVLEFDSLRKRKMFEFTSFRTLAYLIIIMLRFLLGDFFIQMIELEFLPIGFFIFNMIFLISLIFFIYKYYDFEFIKGDFNIEKVKTKNRKSKSKLQK